MATYYYITEKKSEKEFEDYKTFIEKEGETVKNNLLKYGKRINGDIVNENSMENMGDIVTSFINNAIYSLSFDDKTIGVLLKTGFSFQNDEFHDVKTFMKYYEKNGGDETFEIKDEGNNKLSLKEMIKIMER